MSHKELLRIEVLVDDVVDANVAACKAEEKRMRAAIKLSEYLRSLETKEEPKEGAGQ